MTKDRQVIEEKQFGTLQVEHSVVIKRPIKEVFEYTSNPKNTREWTAGIREMEQTSEGLMNRGTRGVQSFRILGRQVDVDWEVTEYVPNAKITIQTTSKVIPPIVVAEYFEPIDRGTLVTFVAQGTPDGIFRLVTPIAGRIYKRQLEADLTTLKYLLESQAAVEGFLHEWQE